MAGKSATRPCPRCREDIPDDATRCRYCSSFVSVAKPNHEGTCPFCRSDIKPDAVLCRFCHSYVGTGGPSAAAQAAAAAMVPTMRARGPAFVDVTPPFEISPEGLPDGKPIALGCTACRLDTGSLGGLFDAAHARGQRTCVYLICEKVGESSRCRVETRTEECSMSLWGLAESIYDWWF